MKFDFMTKRYTKNTSRRSLRSRRSRSVAGYSRQTLPWTICRSVCLSVQCIVEKTADQIRMPFSADGSSDEAGSGVWRLVHGKGYFWGRIWDMPLSTGTYMAYVCYSAATWLSCQITLGRLVYFSSSVGENHQKLHPVQEAQLRQR